MTVAVDQTARAPVPLAYQQIVGLAASTALTVPDGTAFAEVSVSGQSVRWRADGTTPTAAIGMPLPVGTTRQFFLSSLALIRFIETAASATLDITYFGVA